MQVRILKRRGPPLEAPLQLELPSVLSGAARGGARRAPASAVARSTQPLSSTSLELPRFARTARCRLDSFSSHRALGRAASAVALARIVRGDARCERRRRACRFGTPGDRAGRRALHLGCQRGGTGARRQAGAEARHRARAGAAHRPRPGRSRARRRGHAAGRARRARFHAQRLAPAGERAGQSCRHRPARGAGEPALLRRHRSIAAAPARERRPLGHALSIASAATAQGAAVLARVDPAPLCRRSRRRGRRSRRLPSGCSVRGASIGRRCRGWGCARSATCLACHAPGWRDASARRCLPSSTPPSVDAPIRASRSSRRACSRAGSSSTPAPTAASRCCTARRSCSHAWSRGSPPSTRSCAAFVFSCTTRRAGSKRSHAAGDGARDRPGRAVARERPPARAAARASRAGAAAGADARARAAGRGHRQARGTQQRALSHRQSEDEGLTRLIERLQARLGAGQVQRLAPVEDHRPERASLLQGSASGAPCALAAAKQQALRASACRRAVESRRVLRRDRSGCSCPSRSPSGMRGRCSTAARSACFRGRNGSRPDGGTPSSPSATTSSPRLATARWSGSTARASRSRSQAKAAAGSCTAASDEMRPPRLRLCRALPPRGAAGLGAARRPAGVSGALRRSA